MQRGVEGETRPNINNFPSAERVWSLISTINLKFWNMQRQLHKKSGCIQIIHPITSKLGK